MFKSHLELSEMPYTGKELRPHFILEKTKIYGNAILAFHGECLVPIESMVDMEDRIENSPIYSKQMLHFICEFFDCQDLTAAVLRQRLFIAIIIEEMRKLSPTLNIRRSGDDIFVNDKKLSVSIATNSAVSTLIHIGINIDPTGAPIAAIGLNEINVPWKILAENTLQSITNELHDIWIARVKVISR